VNDQVVLTSILAAIWKPYIINKLWSLLLNY